MDKSKKVFVVSSAVSSAENDGKWIVEGVYDNKDAAEGYILHLFESSGYVPHPIDKERELSKLLYSSAGEEYYMYLAQKGRTSLSMIINAMELLERFDEVAN